MTRREIIGTLGLAAGAALVAPGGCASTGGGSRAATPSPRPALYDVRAFGANGDGKTLDSPAINRAIDAATAAGGGTVYVPPGTYRCGTVVLQSNVTLYLEAGSTVLGSTDLADYTPQPGPPPAGDANERHLVFAKNAENVTLTGPGKLDGNGESYWFKRGRTPPADDWGDVATFDYHFRPRPSPMLEFYRCRNLRIEQVRIENSPGWTLRPMACRNVFIRGITIRNPIHGPNCDGIDPTCCENLTISDCQIETADDAICLKSEDVYGNATGVSRNVLITNCYLTGCCNGIKFGTATFGGYENITVSNCVIANDDVPVPGRVIAGIAIEMVDGGYVDGVTVSNVRMQRVRSPIFVRLGARHPSATSRPAAEVVRGRSFLRGVMISNVHATGATMTGSITGQPGSPVEDVTLRDIRIDTEEAERYPDPTAAATTQPVPEVPKDYPEARMFGRLPASGLYLRHVRDVRLSGVRFGVPANETRPAVVADDVERLEIDGLRSTPIAGGGPLARLIDVRGAFVRGAVAPEGCRALLRIEGEQTRRVALTGSDLTDAARTFDLGPGVPAGAARAAANIAAP